MKIENIVKNNIINGIFFIIIAFILYKFYSRGYLIAYESDFRAHSETSLLLFNNIRTYGIDGIRIFKETADYSAIIAYPIWHTLVYLAFLLIRLVFSAIEPETSLMIATGIIASLITTFTYYVVYRYIKLSFKNNISDIMPLFISLALMIVGPLDASKYLGGYYLGGYSGNIWHNPTYLIIRPIGLLIILLYAKIFSDKQSSKKEYYFVSLLLLLSAFCKPNFYQSFVPALVLYCITYFLVYRKKDVFIECLKIAATCAPIGVVAVIQYINALFNSEATGGIGFSPLYVWSYFTPNWMLSLIVSIAFILAASLLIIVQKKIDKEVLLSLCMLLSALLQYMFLYIKAFPFYGDFSWGFDLAIFYCFVILSGKIISQINVVKIKSAYGILYIFAGLLFILHLYFGAKYFMLVWNTGYYLGVL